MKNIKQGYTEKKVTPPSRDTNGLYPLERPTDKPPCWYVDTQAALEQKAKFQVN